MTRPMRNRRAIALLATLSLIAAVSVVVIATSRVSNDARKASLNRMQFMRDLWIADGCASEAISIIDESLSHTSDVESIRAMWSNLDSIVARKRLTFSDKCHVILVPSGTAISANGVTELQLNSLLGTSVNADTRDSMIAAFLDWRDSDSIPRANGAESDWYIAHARPRPRNGNFQSVHEVQLVRGWESADSLLDAFTVEQHRIVLDRAPRTVLSTVNGLPREAMEWILRHPRDMRGRDVSEIMSRLSIATQELLAKNYADIRSATSIAPEVWYVQCSSYTHRAAATAVRMTIQSAGNRVHVVQRMEVWQ